MTKNRIVKYATNTALLAVLAAAGIGAYQLGTSKPEENIQEEQEFVEMEQSTEEEPMVDVGTTEVEADMENTSGDLAGTEMEDGANGNEAELYRKRLLRRKTASSRRMELLLNQKKIQQQMQRQAQ